MFLFCGVHARSHEVLAALAERGFALRQPPREEAKALVLCAFPDTDLGPTVLVEVLGTGGREKAWAR